MKRTLLVVLWGTLAYDAFLVLSAALRLQSDLLSGLVVLFFGAILVVGNIVAEA